MEVSSMLPFLSSGKFLRACCMQVNNHWTIDKTDAASKPSSGFPRHVIPPCTEQKNKHFYFQIQSKVMSQCLLFSFSTSSCLTGVKECTYKGVSTSITGDDNTWQKGLSKLVGVKVVKMTHWTCNWEVVCFNLIQDTGYSNRLHVIVLSLQVNARMVPQSDQRCFLPGPFQFINH
jgi:hypothetical protein